MDVMRMEIGTSSTALLFYNHLEYLALDTHYIENCSTANLIKFLWAAKNIISFPAAKTILMTEKMRLMRLIYDYERIYKCEIEELYVFNNYEKCRLDIEKRTHQL